MKLNPGGRPGGEVKFMIGLLLAVVGLWFFFDSVRISAGHGGVFSGMMRGGGGGRGGMGETTSMGIVLVPLFLGIVALFFNARQTWAWVLTWIGLAIIIIEIVSRFRPVFDMKSSHALIMLVLIAGGSGMMLRGYVEERRSGGNKKDGEE